MIQAVAMTCCIYENSHSPSRKFILFSSLPLPFSKLFIYANWTVQSSEKDKLIFKVSAAIRNKKKNMEATILSSPVFCLTELAMGRTSSEFKL